MAWRRQTLGLSPSRPTDEDLETLADQQAREDPRHEA
jgi:hypothetical protein